MRRGRFGAIVSTVSILLASAVAGAEAAGDLSRQTPVEVTVELGKPGQHVFVPVAAGRVTDLRCGFVGDDAIAHADHGMVGEIVID